MWGAVESGSSGEVCEGPSCEGLRSLVHVCQRATGRPSGPGSSRLRPRRREPRAWSSGPGRAPFLALHRRHDAAKFRQLSPPPRDRETMWSTQSAGCPQ